MRITNQDASPHVEMTTEQVIVPPDGTPVDLVNVGELLAEVAKACDDVAANLQPTSTIPDSAAAFIRLGRAFAAAAQALGSVQVFVPTERGHP